MFSIQDAKAITEKNASSLIDFTQRIVATPSLSGEEADVAEIIVAEMKRLKFDEVWTDDVGNIIGKIRGGNGPTIMLNGHMDIVDPGPDEGWPHPSFSGAVVDGELWGRGSVDMKGPVAAMIYGAAQFKEGGHNPAGDVLMTVAVMEEIGGLGSQFLATHLSADAAIVGEPCRNELRLGHRGRLEIQVRFFGRSAHASVPELAINPHFAAAEFLNRLADVELDDDEVLGQASLAPTLYRTDQSSANVIPSEATVFLDWRNVPSETVDVALDRIHAVLADCPSVANADDSQIRRPEVEVTRKPFRTYTGVARDFLCQFPPFSTAPDSVIAKAARATIETSLGEDRGCGVWQFATDGGHLSAAGIPCIGFGPGNDQLAHTNQERISLAQLQSASATYAPLVIALADALDGVS